MLKRILPLVVVLVAFLAAPSAMATCFKCRVFPDNPCPRCTVAFGGELFVNCYSDQAACDCEADTACTTLAAQATTPALASEYTVASVERLDDAQPSPARPLVASNSLTPSAIH